MNNNKAYSTKVKNLDELNQLVGNELGISKWIEITQENINVFLDYPAMNCPQTYPVRRYVLPRPCLGR